MIVSVLLSRFASPPPPTPPSLNPHLPSLFFLPQVAGVGVILHTLVVALLHCPPLLSLVCSCVSYTRGSFFGPVALEFGSGSGRSSGGDGWLGFGRGGGGGVGVYDGSGGRESMCMEMDW